jgi:hypothetical protein
MRSNGWQIPKNGNQQPGEVDGPRAAQNSLRDDDSPLSGEDRIERSSGSEPQ